MTVPVDRARIAIPAAEECVRAERALREGWRSLEPALTGPRGTILLIDVSGMGGWNDRLGVAAGDELLARLGVRLREWTAPSVVARMAGDQFAIVRPGARRPRLAVAALSTRLRTCQSLGAPVRLHVGAAAWSARVPWRSAMLVADRALRAGQTIP